MRLSPPNPKRAGLRAFQAAPSAIAAFTVIQAMVRNWSRCARATRSVDEGDVVLAINFAFYAPDPFAARRLQQWDWWTRTPVLAGLSLRCGLNAPPTASQAFLPGVASETHTVL